MDRVAYETFAKLEHDHFWFVSRRRIFTQLLDAVLGAPESATGTAREPMLDIGCGAGGMMGMLARYGDVVGLDVDREYLVYCRERGFANVLCGSGYELPFPDGKFALVSLFDTLEHIPEEVQALREVRRVLKPGGRVLISVPAYQWLWSQNDRIAHHCRRYTRGRLRKALEDVGLVVERVSHFNTWLLPMIVPAVLLQKLREKLGLLPDGYNNMSVPLPGPLNRLFAAVMSSERHLLRRFDLPVGHSALALARRAD